MNDVMKTTCRVNEIFYSVQGESTWAGERCVFVRLTGCHLRCHYCDTEYAFREGTAMTIEEIAAEVDRIGNGCDLVEVTGGEPLLQKSAATLMKVLCDQGKTVMVETSGACDISVCDSRVIRIMDLKSPGSGEVDRNDWANIAKLSQQDEVKFVLCDRADYEWARDVIAEHQLDQKVKAVLISAAGEMAGTNEIKGVAGLDPKVLTEWVLEDGLNVRMQVQMHKVIWDPMLRGV
ncbi:radical SAM protein [Poriferisphaera sp. WC338]|uniref:radical SAM protein n=1 Tax=Poriferisphaera sp. WC338 TaxID=3425129 RepID=UPI003D817289